MTTKKNWYVCKLSITFRDTYGPDAFATREKAIDSTRKELVDVLKEHTSSIVNSYAKITCRKATKAEIKRHEEFYGK